MLISRSHKFVFIHIFKTAGTSVRTIFYPYSRPMDWLVYHKNTRILLSKIIGEKNYHRKLIPAATGFKKHSRAIEAFEYLGEKKYKEYFSFAFVRNPYDWMVSLYFFVKRSKNHDDHKIANTLPFADFVKHQIANKISLQSEFVTDQEGKLIVDFIGKFEQLEEDLHLICKKLHIPFEGLPHKNVSDGRKQKAFGEFYTSESRVLMQDYFKEDFERFNYPL